MQFIKKADRVISVLVGVIFGLVLTGYGSVAFATIYSAGSLLQTGDVKTEHILNGTILDADVSNSAGVGGAKVNPRGTAGTLLYTTGSAVGTTTLAKLDTSTGDLYLFGGRIHATSTNFNGVSATWPSVDGSNGQTLTTNGSGTYSWGTPTSDALTWTGTAGEVLTAREAVYAVTREASGGVISTTNTTNLAFGVDATSVSIGQDFYVRVGHSETQIIASVIKEGAPGDSVQISIQADVSGSPSGTPLTTATVVGSTLSTNPTCGDVTFTLSPTIVLSGGTRYWMVLERTGSLNGSNYYITCGSTSSSYADGNMKRYQSGAWVNFAGYDLRSTISNLSDMILGSSASNAGTASAIGLTQSAYATGTSAVIQVAGAQSGLSGLTAGSRYYVANATGTISTSAGTVSSVIGRALSTTTLLVIPN